MKKFPVLLFTLLISTVSKAQFIKEKSIKAQIGFGITIPEESADEIADDGFFAQGELILKAASWVDFRPYAGFVNTNSNGKDLHDNPTDEKAETKAVLIGAKTRLRAPIPWVAPFIEIGIGTSIGKFETFTAYHTIGKSGLVFHIPFSFGLELGRNHGVDLAFTYYAMPSVKQTMGAFAVGLTFPLNKV